MQKKHHDTGTKLRTFKLNDGVYVKDFPHPKKWAPGKLVEVRGSFSYLVELCDGRVVRRHVDALFAKMTDALLSVLKHPELKLTALLIVSLWHQLWWKRPRLLNLKELRCQVVLYLWTEMFHPNLLHQSGDQQGIDHLQNVMVLAKYILRDSSFLEREECGISPQTLWTYNDLCCVCVLVPPPYLYFGFGVH